MVIDKNKFNGILLAFFVVFFSAFDGFLFSLGVLSDSGSLNLYMVLISTALLVLFFTFNLSKTIGIIKVRENLSVIILTLSLISVFLIVSVFTEFKIKLLRDSSYAFFYMLLFLFFNSSHKFHICTETFLKIVIISTIILLPFFSIFLGADIFPRFGSIYGTPSLTGNTIAFSASIIILNWRRYFSSGWSIILIAFALLFVILSGSRTALTLLVLSSIIKFLASRSLLNSITNIFFLLLFVMLFSYVNLGNIDTFSELRVLNVDDIQIGSISTRIIWLSIVINELSESFWVGGFGSGASESLLGVIMHADLLQIYFDYSFLALIIYLLIIYHYAGTNKDKYFVLYFLCIFLLGLQNAYFAPIIMVIYLSLRISSSQKNEKQF